LYAWAGAAQTGFNPTTSNPNENAGVVNIPFTVINAVLGGDSLVTFNVAGTATGADYTSTLSATVPTGSVNGTLQITITNDNLFEGSTDETIIVSFKNPSIGITNKQHTLSINDDDGLPTASFSTTPNPASGLEDNLNISVTVTLSHPSTQDITVKLGYAGTTANNPDYDIMGLSGADTEAEIDAGDLSKTFTLKINEDNTEESNEEVIITILNDPNTTDRYTVGAINTYRYTIVDEDGANVFLVAKGITAGSIACGGCSCSIPTTNVSILSISPDEKVNFTAIPPNASNFKFKLNDAEVTPAVIATLNSQNREASVQNNVFTFKPFINDEVSVELQIGSSCFHSRKIRVSNSPFTDLDSKICLQEPPFNFQISDSDWSIIDPALNSYPRFKRIIDANNNVLSTTRNATITPTSIGAGNNTISVICDFSFTINNVPFIFESFYGFQDIEVGDSTEATISPSLARVYCESDPTSINLSGLVSPEAQPGSGEFEISGGTLPSPQIIADYIFEPTDYDAGTYTLRYTHENQFGCESSESAIITINPRPSAAFMVQDTCFNDFTKFIATDNGANLTWFWSYDNTPFSNEKEPVFRFFSAGTYEIRLIVTNSITGCINEEIREITIGALPVANFEFKSKCVLNNVATIQFTDLSTMPAIAQNPNGDVIDTRTWDFGDATIPSTDTSPEHTYANAGFYTVKLTVESNKGCISVYQKSFFLGEDGWIAKTDQTDDLFSWKYKIPDGSSITHNTALWITDITDIKPDTTFYPNEQSFVESPCFDLSTFKYPMVSLNIWADTDRGADGAVLLYKVEGTSIWKTLGVQGGGLNWYDEKNLLGKPADEIINLSRFGWAGKYDTLTVGSYNLDQVKSEAGTNLVRFRVAFGSNADNPAGQTFDGFAFDNLRILERRKVVLLEHFTNSNESGAVIQQSDYLKTFEQIENNENILALRYHTNFPTADAAIIQEHANKADISARALWYGIQKPGLTRMDGTRSTGTDSLFFKNNAQDGWGPREHSRRILVEPLLKISLSNESVENDNALKLKVTVERETDAPEISDSSVVIQVAVVQDSFDLSGTKFPYVLRKFIPDAAGALHLQKDALNTPQTTAVEWIPFKNFNLTAGDFTLIAFVQGEDTKEIYQVAVLPLTKNIIAPTGRSGSIEESEYFKNVTAIRNEDVRVYPNPTDDFTQLLLTGKLKKSETLIITDLRGQIAGTRNILPEKNEQWIDTQDLPAGMYLLHLGNACKKLIITR
jgi:PKD repeat protein